MIFYGWRKKSLHLADMHTQACSRCGTPGLLQLFVTYTSVHLYWIFGVVTSRKYIAVCSGCRGGVQYNKQEVGHLITHNPVPFMDRWGLAVLAAAGILAVVVYSGTR